MTSVPPPRNPRAGIPSFETKLENEEEVLDAMLMALSKNQLDEDIWTELHDAAVKHDRVSELAFAYESIAQGRKLKTFLPPLQAELFFRAATFFGEVLGDEFGATTYLERALGAHPAHTGAFERIDAQLTRVDDNKKLADLCTQTAPHRPRGEQVVLLKRAAVLYERAGLEDKAIETYQHLVRIDPADEQLRDALEARYLKANRYRDVARMLEQALAAGTSERTGALADTPAPDPDDLLRIRAKLIDVFANQLKEPERAMPHVEALLDADPSNPDARRIATRLLESKGLAARAAAALAAGAPTTAERARYLGIELENTRGPRRRDVLRRIGILKQDELSDPQGAFEAFEQALGIDPADDELRRRYSALGTELKGPLEVARTFARVSTVAKDASIRSRITAEMGELLLRGGDTKRARTTLAGVLSAPSADPGAVLIAARSLAGVYEAENDSKNLVEVLSRIGELSADEEEKQQANERVARICTELGDTERAIAAWRRLVDSPFRARALEALEPLYEQRSEWIDLSFVLEQRAKDMPDRRQARELSFKAAEVLTTKARDGGSASEAWRQMIETYGPAKDIYAQWIPILESARQWPELAQALAKDASLSAPDQRPTILARLAHVYLTRMRDAAAAIESFKEALALDPLEKTSRATLEKLLAAGEHRLDAADVLEPIYRREDDVTGLLRVLDIKATLSPIVQDRLAALEEAADAAISVSREKALDIVARGLAEAVESEEAIGPWLGRFDLFAGDTDRKKRAEILGKGLGDHAVTSKELLLLAKRVGEEHAAAGDVNAALVVLRRALAFEPGSTELIRRVDELLQEQGNPGERVALYRAALERGPEPARRKELLHSIGRIERSELSNPEAAIGAYKRAIKEDPADFTAHTALVELYEETAGWDDLADALEAYLPHASSPEQARATRAKLADVAASHGQPERAAANAKALLDESELTPGDLDLVERVATQLSNDALLRGVLERRLKDSTDPRQQVQCLDRLAGLDRAAGYMTEATERLRQAAELARGVGEDAVAIALLHQLREIDPRDEAATRQLVELYERAGDYVRVPSLVRSLLELTNAPEDRVRLFRNLAATLAEKIGDLPGAFGAAREAFALAPTEKDVLGELEALAVRTGAVEDFADAIADAVVNIGGASPGTATELSLAKARVLSTKPETMGDAAIAYRMVLDRAADEAHRAVAADGLAALLAAMPPSDSRTSDVRWLHEWRVNRAPAEEKARALAAWAEVEESELGAPEKALELYKRVVEADAENVDALAAVARLSLAQGDVDGALEALTARRSVSEGDAKNALDVQIATILADRPGRGREAVERIAWVLEAAPHDPGALELAARLLRDPDAGTKAAEVLEKSLDAVDDPAMRVDILKRLLAHGEGPATGDDTLRLSQYERLLDILAELGNHEEAFETVLRAAGEMPRHAQLWDRAENVARQLSSPDRLALLYEAALRTDLSREDAVELGQRAVAFYEEWFEDGGRVVGILERLLEIDPHDTWAFDRLKLIFDAQERWDDLFALYDRAAASSEKERRVELLEEAAQIAKDFANHSKRAIGYFEQLLELKPGNARLSSALERLYERHGCHRELIGLRGNRIGLLPLDEAQKERARIATLWLDELGDASSALIVIEDILSHQPDVEGEPPLDQTLESPGAPIVDVTDLLERVLAVAPKTQEVRESVLPPPEGRRDSYMPTAPKRGLVRQRAAALLKERYSGPGREADLARVLEVELEAVKSVKERIRRHQQIAALYAQLGDDEHAMDHFVNLVLLEPEVPAHRAELAQLAARVGRFDRLAEVLVSAADDCNDDALKVELLMHAGVVTATKLEAEGGAQRAIELFFRILGISPISDAALLEACRHVEPLLEKEGRKSDRLDVLERLAILEDQPEVRWKVLGDAARLATELTEDDRAIWAWEGRLETAPEDPEALDGLVHLFEKGERWKPLIDVLQRRAKLEGRTREQQRADRVRVATISSEKLDAIEDAIAAWTEIERTFGDSDDGTRALSALYRSTRRWQELADLLAGAAARTEGIAEKAEILRELGDVQREQLEAMTDAIASYEAALGHDPRSEGSRIGLRALLKRSEHRADVVRVLLLAYNAADDWRLVLDLTEHRLGSAKEVAGQIAILMEAARISETRAQDTDAAFSLVRRALLLDPGEATTVEEIFRLAALTRSYRSLADAIRECVEGGSSPSLAEEAGPKPWARGLRFKMGGVLENHLDELRAALDAYVHVAHEEPSDLEAARAVIRVAGRTMRWDAAARAIVETTRAREKLEPELVQAVEEAAGAASGWDAITFALASLVHDGGGLPPNLARDVEAAIAVWHRDRRGDPDAAEAAFQRALAHDNANATMLSELAKLQRRVKGRPLVDSLLRLSQATGGDLDLLTEAADAALSSVGDRALSKSILERLLRLAIDRWSEPGAPAAGAASVDVDGNVISGSPASPDTYVDRATRELVRIHSDDGDHDKVVALLVETSSLPWPRERARGLRHEAARIAIERQQAADRAIGIYLGLVDDDPHDNDAVERLVRIYESLGRKSELLELKRRLVGTAKDGEARLALRLEAASLEDALGEPDKAIKTLRENLEESPRHDVTVDELSRIFSREGKYEELEALFANQASLAENAGERSLAADLHARAAMVAETKLGNVPSAIAHLQRVVALEERAPALDALARLSTVARDHEGAANYLDRLRDMTEGPARSGITLRLADALVAAGRKGDAEARLESEVKLDPESDHVRMRLAEFYRANQGWGPLAELLTEGATHAPDKATRLSRLREAAELHRHKTGTPGRAIPLLEQAADLAPDDNAVKLALADALGAAGRFDEARNLLRVLVDAFGGRRPKERAPVHYHLARLDLAVGDRARALVELDAATRIDPANPEILRTLAELARDDGQLDRAERSYRALLTVLRRQEEITDDAPISRSEVLFELSQIAVRQGEPDRAKEILESAFELATESLVEARRLEGALRRGGDSANLSRALEARLARGATGPDAADLYGDLGRLYEDQGKSEEAFEMRLKALELDPSSAEVHESASRLATTLGHVATYEERVRALADVARDGRSPGGGRPSMAPDPELAAGLYVRLARLAETQRHDDREAAELYERAVSLRERDRSLLTALDKVYERLGDDAGQARVLGMSVAIDTEEGGASAETLYRLAQLRFKSNDVDAACDAFEQAYATDSDLDRALAVLQAAAEAHPTHQRLVSIYEHLARSPGRERVLVDALVKRWSLPGSNTEPMRSAVELAEELEDRELAESLLRRYLEAGQDDRTGRVWALARLAFLSEMNGNHREAASLKREAAEIAEPDEARRFLYEVAGLASGPLADLRLAATIYEELHERDPVDRDAWELLLDVYRRTGDFDKLVALIQSIVGYVDDRSERSRLRLERVRISMEKLRLSDDDAANELREIVDEDPAQVDAAILLGSILERSGREEDLVELLTKQLDAAKDRQDADAVSSLSRRVGQLLEPRDPQQAREVYYAALDWDPRAKELLVALEALHGKDGEHEQRADVMERRLALEHGADAERLALELAELRRGADDADAALRALELGFQAAPQSRDLRERLETHYREQLEFGKLAELYMTDARGRTDPASRSARLREAAKLYREELADPEQGARVLREAREADPSSHDLLLELVDMLSASGDLKLAADELGEALKKLEDGPVRTDLVGRRAVIRSRLGEGEAAHADFEEAIAGGLVDLRGPLAEHLGKLALSAAGRGDAQLWRQYRLRIAQLRLEMGDIEDARNVLTELLKTDSKDKATLRAIAHVDELEQRWDAASATYRRLVGLEDANGIVSAALKLSEVCEKAGRLADARGGLERARMAAPDDVELRKRLAWLYEQLGAVKELAELVLEEARAAGDVAPRFEGLMRAGQLFLELTNDPDQTAQMGTGAAVAPLEEAHALRPTDLDCAALLSDAYVGAARFEEAQELLMRTIGTFKGRRARELSALYHRLARVAEVLGDKTAELQHLTTALDMDAQNGVVASELAYRAMELGNLDLAQRALRAVTMLKQPAPLPKAMAYQHLGEIARQQGDVKRAMMLVKRAIDDDPTLESAKQLLEALQSGG
ncbi:MAG: tetratricopeptide repeat protein [Deltaproteobacteria bacterium]|nr:tetratricopeptide repeat protein [Deltaproteobacteria bacterium]